jgi:hypothetical protein
VVSSGSDSSAVVGAGTSLVSGAVVAGASVVGAGVVLAGAGSPPVVVAVAVGSGLT